MIAVSVHENVSSRTLDLALLVIIELILESPDDETIIKDRNPIYLE